MYKIYTDGDDGWLTLHDGVAALRHDTVEAARAAPEHVTVRDGTYCGRSPIVIADWDEHELVGTGGDLIHATTRADVLRAIGLPDDAEGLVVDEVLRMTAPARHESRVVATRHAYEQLARECCDDAHADLARLLALLDIGGYGGPGGRGGMCGEGCASARLVDLPRWHSRCGDAWAAAALEAVGLSSLATDVDVDVRIGGHVDWRMSRIGYMAMWRGITLPGAAVDRLRAYVRRTVRRDAEMLLYTGSSDAAADVQEADAYARSILHDDERYVAAATMQVWMVDGSDTVYRSAEDLCSEHSGESARRWTIRVSVAHSGRTEARVDGEVPGPMHHPHGATVSTWYVMGAPRPVVAHADTEATLLCDAAAEAGLC